MPVDPIRLQPFFDRVTTASATYDTALRAHGEATRALALNPTSAQARARLRAAVQALTTARTALDQARHVFRPSLGAIVEHGVAATGVGLER